MCVCAEVLILSLYSFIYVCVVANPISAFGKESPLHSVINLEV